MVQYSAHCVSRSALKSELPARAVDAIRGKGLMNAIVVAEGFDAWDICVEVIKFNWLELIN